MLKFGITSYLMEDNYFLHQKNHPPVVLWSRTAFFFFVSSSKDIFLPGKRSGSNLCCRGCLFKSRRVHRAQNYRNISLLLLLIFLWGLSAAWLLVWDCTVLLYRNVRIIWGDQAVQRWKSHMEIPSVSGCKVDSTGEALCWGPFCLVSHAVSFPRMLNACKLLQSWFGSTLHLLFTSCQQTDKTKLKTV